MIKVTRYLLALLACATLAQGAVKVVTTIDNQNTDPLKLSLQEALATQADGDQIHFNIPGDGPHYIVTPANGYPEITAHNVTIDGYTQPDAVPNTNPITAANNARIKIVLDSRLGGRTVLNHDGYSTHESAILGVVGGQDFTVRGLCFLGVWGSDTDEDPALYMVAFARKASGGQVAGCWLGVDLDGTSVHGANAGITGFRYREEGVPFLSDNITVGLKAGSPNPRAEFNVLVGAANPIVIEGRAQRVSGNFIGVLPSGTNDWIISLVAGSPGFGGHIKAARDCSDLVIGTDGDGVNDADERNIFGGMLTDALGGYNTMIEFYGGGLQTDMVIAGNYFGLGVDGTTRFTNSARLVNRFVSTATCQIGSDFDGVSDALEANLVNNNWPLAYFYAEPAASALPEFILANDGARISVRGNQLVNNFAPPYAVTTPGYDTYYAPYVLDPARTVPTVDPASTTSSLLGTVPQGSAEFSRVLVDVYLPDPEGLTNGLLFAMLEFPEGFPQGLTYLGTFEDDGPEDLHAGAGQFEFNIAPLGLATGTQVVVSANFTADAKGTHRGHTHTSPWSLPVALLQGTMPTPISLGSITRSAANVTLSWSGGVAPYTVLRRTDIQTGNWETVTTTSATSVTVAADGVRAFFRIQGN